METNSFGRPASLLRHNTSSANHALPDVARAKIAGRGIDAKTELRMDYPRICIEVPWICLETLEGVFICVFSVHSILATSTGISYTIISLIQIPAPCTRVNTWDPGFPRYPSSTSVASRHSLVCWLLSGTPPNQVTASTKPDQNWPNSLGRTQYNKY